MSRAAIALVALLAERAVGLGDVVVAVPGLDVAVEELDEADAALDQPAGDEELPGLDAGAVHVADVLRLLLDVEGVGGRHLHPVGQLEAGDPRLEVVVLGAGLLVPPVELGQEVELPPLVGLGHDRVADVLDQVLGLLLAGVDVGPLVDAGQEGRSPVGDVGDRQAGAHGDVAGQVLVLGPHPVGQPGPHARAREPLVAAVHQPHRLFVVGRIGVHRADDAQVIDVLGRPREDLAHLDAALRHTSGT